MTFRYQSILLPILLTTLISSAVLCKLTNVNKRSVTASLKPQSPIAGTNIFLNTPYRWHDRSKPGCYATWFMEKYKDCSEKWPGVRMVCSKQDQEYYDTLDAAWVFERTDGSESSSAYYGKVKIKNIGRRQTLDTWKSTNTWWVGLGAYDEDPSRDMWRVRTDPENKNNLQLEIENWYIAQDPAPNHQTYAYLIEGRTLGYPYSFLPTVKFEANMYDFVFTQPMDGQVERHSSKKDLIDSYDINNDSPGSLTRAVRVSEKITNEFSWGLSQSLKASAKVKGKAGVPFIAEGEVETGFEINFTSNQNWKTSAEKSFEMSYTVNVPPHTKVCVSAWYELIKDISLEYTATSEITGNTTRISDFDDLVYGSPATGEMIRSQLEYSRFDGTVVQTKEYSVIVQVRGTMTASVGVRGQLNVDGKTVATQ